MIRQPWHTLAFCVVLLTVGEPICLADSSDDKTANALLAAHNRQRKDKKLEPLTLSLKLCEAAAIQARDMAEHHTLSHKGTDGSSPMDRAKRVGYPPASVGENVAKGQETIKQVMTSWMNSNGHRANILGDYREMGAARVEDDAGINYWCVDFGNTRPRMSGGETGLQPDGKPIVLKPDEAAAAVVKHLNREREARRQVLLHVDPALKKGAMAMSAAMAAKDSMEIDGDPFKLIGDTAIDGREIRVQMSANAPTPERAAKSLAGEDLEKLNGFREVGVGYAVAKSGTPYWCAVFAKRAGLLKRPFDPEP